MTDKISGIHHITAIGGDPQRNLDFYTQVLGLRFVKRTVNFDDPGTYHFYFGDANGHPGTILTFFPWQNARKGQRGLGQVSVIGFNVPRGSLGFWQEHLKRQGVTTSAPFTRFDAQALTLLDPDGLQLELVEHDLPADAAPAWDASPIPAQYAIHGFAAPTLLVRGSEPSAALIAEIFGMRQLAQQGSRIRYEASDIPGGVVDIEAQPEGQIGRMGAGVVHHIAFRAADAAQQLAWRERLLNIGMEVTPVLNRQYFTSIYFREPGGILFEIATDPPGFTLDEPLDALGMQLKLPEWLEPRRAEIEGSLPPIKLTVAQR